MGAKMIINKELLLAERAMKETKLSEIVGAIKYIDALILYADKPEPKADSETKPDTQKGE